MNELCGSWRCLFAAQILMLFITALALVLY